MRSPLPHHGNGEKFMTAINNEYGRRVGFALCFSPSRTRPRFLWPFGWFAILAILAVAIGTVLGFAIWP
jgi:hypothetical protein